MAERGIDISAEYPKPWTDEVVHAADVVITMGCGDACPVFPGHRYLDWPRRRPRRARPHRHPAHPRRHRTSRPRPARRHARPRPCLTPPSTLTERPWRHCRVGCSPSSSAPACSSPSSSAPASPPQQLSPTDTGLQLLQNSLTTVFGLGVLILLFGPVSGAHLNPAVSAVRLGHRPPRWHGPDRIRPGRLYRRPGNRRDRRGAAGQHHVRARSAMADLPTRPRHTRVVGRRNRGHRRTDRAHPHPRPHWPRRTLGRRGRRLDRRRFWFTSSTSFANPAVTIARMFSDTFAGIASSVPGFIFFQAFGAILGAALVVVLYPRASEAADDVATPHSDTTHTGASA